MTDEQVKRGPGRPPRQEQIKKERRRRDDLDLSRNLRLFIPENQKDQNYHYHWLNDEPGRIVGKTKQDDYDIVTEEMLGGVVDAGEGTPVKRAIGTGADGAWKYAYLARKPKEFYDEDKAKEQAQIAAQVEAIRQGSTGPDGLGADDHSYVPEGRQNIIE